MKAIWISFLTIGIIFLEVFVRDIGPFAYVGFFYIGVNVLYWYKFYTRAFIAGAVAGILIDVLLQGHIGESMVAAFFSYHSIIYFKQRPQN